MALTDFTIVTRSLRARLFSTVTTVAMVAVSVALMLALLAMKDAGRRSFERGPGNMHILVSADTGPLPSVLNAVFYARSPARPITWARFGQLVGASGDRPPLPLEYAVPTLQGDSYEGFPTMATSPEFFSKFQPDPEADALKDRAWRLSAGAFFTKPFEVVMGAKAAQGTGATIGQTIYLTHGTGASRAGAEEGDDDHEDDADHHDEKGHDKHGHDEHAHHGAHEHREFPFTVVGILAPTGAAHDRAVFTDLTSSWIIHAHERREREDPKVGKTTEADLIDADKLITGVYIRVKTRPGSDASSAIGPVFEQLRRQTDLTVANPADQVRQLFLIVSNIDQIFLAMAAVVLLCSGLAIMLALYNSMDQRRRQIAVLRVLGASPGRIFGLIVTESAVIGVLGAAAGIALCLGGVRVIAGVLKERLGLVLDADMPLEATLLVAAATVVLASLAGVIPAAVGYRTSVARNLRPLG